MGRGRYADSMRGAIERRPPRRPGVSCPASALPLGPLEQPGLPDVPGPSGAGSPLPVGPTGGAGGPVPRGWILVGPHRQPPGPLQALPPRSPRGQPPRARGAGCTGHATGTSVPSPGGCGRPPPCRPPGRRVHRVPRQVFKHRPAGVVLVCTQGAFCLLRGLPCQGDRHRLSDGAFRRRVKGQVGQRNRVWHQRAARGRCIEGSCRRRGSESLDVVALRVCLQQLLPVRCADLAVGLAPPSQVVEGL